jgi:hypothetical protein
LAERLRIFTTGYWSDGEGYKLTTIGLPKVNDISVLLRIKWN